MYNRLRRHANWRHKETVGDSFHNGSQVLPEVTHWHEYLRRLTRKSDSLTSPVLDLVDEHMLVGEVNSRDPSDGICMLMEEIIREHSGVGWDESNPGFEVLLQDIEDLAESEQLIQDDEVDSIRGPSSSNVSPPLTIHSHFKSTQELLSQHVLPVILRPQQPRAGSPSSRTSWTRGTPRNLEIRQSLEPHQSSDHPTTTISTMVNHKVLTDMWMLENQLKRLNRPSRLDRVLGRNQKARSVKTTKQQSENDELGNYYQHRDIVSSPLVNLARSLTNS